MASSVQQFLGENVRIVLDDGRVIEGEFRCMDKDMNFVLHAAVEYHGMAEAMYSSTSADTDTDAGSGNGSEGVSQRALGSAMVPGQHIVKVLGRAK